MEKRAPTYLYYFHGLDELIEHRVADQALAVHYNDRFFPGARIGLPGEKAMRLNWQIVNTSLTRYMYNDERITMAGFNSFTHLELGGDPSLITYR